jgi:hypothetical protein
MFGAAIALIEDDEEQAALAEESQRANIPLEDGAGPSAFSPSSGAASSDPIGSAYITVKALDEPNQPVLKEGFLHKIGGTVKNCQLRPSHG